MATANTLTAVCGSSMVTCRGDHLIPDVLTAVFDFLDLNELLRCMKTCRRWRIVSQDHPTFSRRANLRSLAPSHYSRFLAQILFKEHSSGALWVSVTLPYDSVIPRKLREMLKRVWPRMVRFTIEARDADSAVAILSNPSPRLQSLVYFSRNSRADCNPQLSAAFLGGHAPVLYTLTTMLVVVPSAPRLAVLANVEHFYAGGCVIGSLKNIPVQFPRLQHLEIVEPAIESPLGEADIAALLAFGEIPHITLQFHVCPQWTSYLLDALPLSAIRRLSIALPQGADDRHNIQPGALHDIIFSMPGDLSIVMHTDRDAQRGKYDFVVTSADARGRTFQRDIALGVHLPYLGIPQCICARIVRLGVHAPDWERTCLWLSGLQRLAVFKVVFADEALLRDLLRPDRAFVRRPVPMSFMHTTLVEVVGVGRPLEVDYGLLHAFLRKGTMQPCIPLHAYEQRIMVHGLKLTGEAEVLLRGESDSPKTVTVDVYGITRSIPPDW